MVRQWYGFFELVPEKGVRKFFAFFLVLSHLIIPGVSCQNSFADLPVASPSAAPTLDPEFLNLPAFDIEALGKPNAEVKVGDPLEFKVNLVNPSGAAPFPPELTLGIPSGINLSEQGWVLAPQGNHLKFQVTPIKSGPQTLPTLALKDASGKAVARTNPFQLTIASSIQQSDPKPTQPEDVEPPVALNFPVWIVILLGMLGLAVLGGAGYGFYAWRKKRKPKEKKIPEIIRTEDEIAFSELIALEKKELLKKKDFKTHYFRVSEILKAYVGARFRFDALESTAREILIFLEDQRALNDTTLDRLEMLFEKLDRVKFTDLVPSDQEAAHLIPETREFIFQTLRPKSILKPEGASPNAVQ